MKLSELIYAFKENYDFECRNRNIPPKQIGNRLIALKLSIIGNDIQKNFGVIELSLTKTLTIGVDKYDLTSSVMEVKNVVIGVTTLIKKSTDWMENKIAMSGSPGYYTILYQGAIPKIWIYPSPASATDSMIINFEPNFNLYSPSSVVAGDFGDFGIAGKGFSGDTVFPTQYDNLLLLGLMKEVIGDFETQYEKEKALMKVKQFNGEKFDYDPDWGE